MSKKVLIISTSLRNGSNSEILAKEVEKGAKEAGHDVEFIHVVCDQICVLYQGTIFLEGNKYDVFAQEEQLKKMEVQVPQMISFSHLVSKRVKINIGYRDDINDLIKDVYRYVK